MNKIEKAAVEKWTKMDNREKKRCYSDIVSRIGGLVPDVSDEECVIIEGMIIEAHADLVCVLRDLVHEYQKMVNNLEDLASAQEKKIEILEKMNAVMKKAVGLADDR